MNLKEKSLWDRKETIDLYHERANHEDNLYISRTNIFLVFNGLMAVAVSLIKDETIIQILIVGILLVINLFWLS